MLAGFRTVKNLSDFGFISVDNCASNDDTADDRGGSGNLINQTFFFVDEANDDYHLSDRSGAVISGGADLSEITLYLGFLPEGLAGTALLCTHCGVAGFHMAGTRPEHRRKGVARQMMHHLIGEARARGLRHATLQASAMGEPLYSQLGFRKQFLLHNYLYTTG